MQAQAQIEREPDVRGAGACYGVAVQTAGPTDQAHEPPRGARARGGGWRLVVTVGVLAAVWWPARPGGHDGFPLSTYPMFGYARSTTSKVDTVLGVGADGQRRPLTPELVGGVTHPKVALQRVIEAVQGRRSEDLCRDVARRVVERPPTPRPITLEVVTETWDTLHALEPGAEARKRVVHARCEVPP